MGSPAYDDHEKDALNDERNPARPRFEVVQGGGDSNEPNGDLRSLEGGESNGSSGLGGHSKGGLGLLQGNKKAGDNGDNGIAKKTIEDDKKDAVAAGRFAKSRAKYTGIKGQASKLLKNKWLAGFGVAGAGAILVVIILIMIFMQALKVPHLMENIATYQSARIVQRMNTQNNRAFRSYIGTKTADSATYKKFSEKYNAKTQPMKDMWSKLDRWRPNQQIKLLNTQGTAILQDSRGRVIGIQIDGKPVMKPVLKYRQQLIPGYKFVTNVRFAQEVAPALNKAIGGNKPAVLVNSKTANIYRKALKVPRVAWKAGQYSGASPQEADRAVVRAGAKVVDDATSESKLQSKTTAITDGSEDVKEARVAALAVDAVVDDAIKNKGGVLQPVKDAVNKVGDDSLFQKGLAAVNPIYAVATPICIVYDGSVSNSGPTIDRNINASSANYLHMSAASDQIKDGKTVDASIAGAYSRKLGPVFNSSAQKTASGEASQPRGTISPHAGAGGIFTMFNVVFGGSDGKSAEADFANGLAENACPVLLNYWVAGGVAVANLIAIGFTGGGAAAVEKAAGQVAVVSVKSAASRIASRLTVGAITNGAKNTTKFVGKQAMFAAGIASTTYLMRMIVANQAGQLAASGTEWGDDAAETTDMSANIYYGELGRKMYYDAPLSTDEVKKSNASDVAFLKKQNKEKNAYTRYLALSNPQSLLSRFGASTYTAMYSSPFASVLTNAKDVVNPVAWGDKFASLMSPPALAGASTTGATYGNIQFGWTKAQLAWLNDELNEPLENQRILSDSGREDDIKNDLGKCFTETTGTLLQNGDILLKSNGQVNESEGACSPNNLGLGNDSYGPDMVMRWRAAQADTLDLDEKLNLQEVTEPTGATGEGLPLSFTAATYNIEHEENHAAGCKQDPCATERSQKQANIITGSAGGNPALDIVGMQEISQPQQNRFNTMLSDYDSFPVPVPKDRGNAIFWNSTKFSKFDEGYISSIDNAGDAFQRPYVGLQSTDGSRKVYVMSVHAPNNVSGGSSTIRKRVAEDARNWALKTKENADTVLLLGDWNENLTSSSIYCTLTADGALQNAIDMVKSPGAATNCPAKDGAGIDHIYAVPQNDLTATGWVHAPEKPPYSSASDHEPVYVTFNFPGLSATSSGAGIDAFKIATWNISVKVNEPQWTTAANNIVDKGMDVVGTQELEKSGNYALVRRIVKERGYAIYPDYGPAEEIARNGLNARAVIYNPDKFSLVKTSFFRYPRNDDKGYSNSQETVLKAQANAPIVHLRSLPDGNDPGGQEIIVLNIHNVAGAGKAYQKQRFDSNKIYISKINQLKAENPGVPIFLTGDFNEGTGVRSSAGTNITLDLNKNNLIYCMFASNGLMKNAQDTASGKPTSCSPERGSDVDFIYATPEVTMRDYKDISKAEAGSDHQARSVVASVPGKPGSGSVSNKDWQWPVKLEDYPGTMSNCFRKVAPGVSGHTGIDISVPSGTAVYAAKGGKVMVAKSSGDAGNAIIIQHDANSYSNYQHNTTIKVSEGQTVEAGQLIAYSGSTGYSFGPHVHFAITTEAGFDSRSKVAYSVNPLDFLPNDRNTGSCR